MNDEYHNPKGHQGQGKDIGWCGRNKGGKRCGLCRHYSEFSTWSVDWFWYYLTEWSHDYIWFNHIHLRYSREYMIKHIRPVKYHTRGLDPKSIKSLFLRGCKPDRKCKCVNVIQRGYWYCPICWKILNSLAKSRNEPAHNLMIQDRKELKADMLILQLSGVI